MDDEGHEWPTRETIVSIGILIERALRVTDRCTNVKLQAMRDLVKDAQPGDHFVFSCKHGSHGFMIEF